MLDSVGLESAGRVAAVAATLEVRAAERQPEGGHAVAGALPHEEEHPPHAGRVPEAGNDVALPWTLNNAL
jgi:hypothetical protein